jgi:beta-N-acetylhexosaminidase
MDKDLFNIYKNSKEYETWPLKEDAFLKTIYGTHKNDTNNETEVFTLEVEGKVVGFVSCKIKNSKGVVAFLFVEEMHRLNSIGSNLLIQSLEWFKANNVDEVVLGAGAGSYIFPGLPKNLHIENFFKKNGFELIDDGLVDMYQDISKWKVLKDIFESVKKENVNIDFSSEKVADQIVVFAKNSFPNWYDYYKSDMEEKNYDKVFYASINDEIVGISKLWIGDCTWDLLFENNVGGGGALGISEKHRGKGIGLAMKAWGTQKIKEKGIKYVWIGWTYEIAFYKKLGFEVWREYYNAKLRINKK